MRTLYVRIVFTFIFITIFSAVVAFLVANTYYQTALKEQNEHKIVAIATKIKEIYSYTDALTIEHYLESIAGMNFQLYLYDANYNGRAFGSGFRENTIEHAVIENVLRGDMYYGISSYDDHLFVTGFFKEDIRNSIGIPITVDEEPMALFVRPDVGKQFGEMRIVLGMLLGLSFLFSIVLIFLLTSHLVRPIRKLTKATKRIANGNYDISLDVRRKDEIGQLAHDFSLMAQSLQKLEHMRQEFVSNVSHEIQSPLTSIAGFSKAIRTHALPKEKSEHYLEIIEKESERLSSLSKQLLLLSSLDNEVKSVTKTVYRLDEQLREVVLLTEWQWQQKEIEMNLDLPTIHIEADQHLLHLVWVNLLTNSIKFTPSNGRIRIDLMIDTDIVVTIHDTGIGMDEHILPHVFERFYKGDPARTRNHTGSGLGLAVVKKIIDLHNGSIDVQSTVGIGSRFIVRLPHHLA